MELQYQKAIPTEAVTVVLRSTCPPTGKRNDNVSFSRVDDHDGVLHNFVFNTSMDSCGLPAGLVESVAI